MLKILSMAMSERNESFLSPLSRLPSTCIEGTNTHLWVENVLVPFEQNFDIFVAAPAKFGQKHKIPIIYIVIEL